MVCILIILHCACDELTVHPIVDVKQTVINMVARFITTGSVSTVTDREMKLMKAGLGPMRCDSADGAVPGAAVVSINEPLVVCALSTHCEDELIRAVGNSMRWAGAPASQGYSYELQVLVIIILMFGGKFRRLGDLFEFHTKFAYLEDLKCELVVVSLVDGKWVASQVGWRMGLCGLLGFKAGTAEELKEVLEGGGGPVFYLPDNNHGADLVGFLRPEGSSMLIKFFVQTKFSIGLNGKLKPGTFRDACVSIDPQRTYKSGFSNPVRVALFPSRFSDFGYTISLIGCMF